MAKAEVTKEDVIEFIANMSVLDLSELIKEMEEKFGEKVKSIGGSNSKWNLGNIGEKYIQKYGNQELKAYHYIPEP